MDSIRMLDVYLMKRCISDLESGRSSASHCCMCDIKRKQGEHSTNRYRSNSDTPDSSYMMTVGALAAIL